MRETFYSQDFLNRIMVEIKGIVTFALIICLISLSAIFFPSVKAQFVGDIIINADGSITQATANVKQVGDIYFLIVNTNQSIIIEKSNLIFDGDNHTLSGKTLYILDAFNVTVRNLTVEYSYQGISINNSYGLTITNDTIKATGASLPFSETWAISIENGNSSRIIQNNIIDNMVGIALAETFGNSIIANKISGSNIGLSFYNSSANVIYYNDISNNSINFQDQSVGLYPYMASTNIWDNGTVGNYWSDYNGNGTYIIDSTNVDYHPLTRQVDIYSIAITKSSNIPELSSLVIVPLLFFMLSLTLILKFKKTANFRAVDR